MEKHASAAAAIFKKAGWFELNASEYFSVTFVRQDGRPHTTPSLPGQLLFSKEYKDNGLLFLTVMPLPTEFYMVRDGRVTVVSFSEPQTLGASIAHKLLRGNKRDITDLTQVGLADDLRRVIGDSGRRLITERVMGDQDLHKKFAEVVGRISDSIRKQEKHGDRYDKELAARNIAELKALRHPVFS